ncbi:ABC transporter permease [Paeniglutamicibacter kerguelensis]|uniref:ABC-type transport system involved in multi-copper enzyme maturation permease subunit n=1 Tax=Paeniglutamicibacter kerguelensis TaxID=254788 RepID=A0ABS4XAM7_9MICC|nr:ABC transporter permease [Paeniglutamicibacter kerguelensis]MBP2385528.1 ABC-type transport system involved in multi-copper enzyme maturation permease subunit [Paeniglutamicibacter kerguelensis]
MSGTTMVRGAVAGPKPGFGAAVSFEATKLWAVRSTRVALAAAFIVHLALTWLLAFSAKASGDNGYESEMPAPFMSLASLQLTQLFIAAIAALAITSEYANGTIISSLQAVPVRRRLLGAKAAVLGMFGFGSGLAMVGVGTLVAAPAAADYGRFTAADLFTALAGGAVYLGLLSLVTLGIGALLRSTAGAITSAFVLIFGLPQILPLFNVEWVRNAAAYLPTTAGQVLGTGLVEPYGAGTALVVLVAWAGVLLGAGLWVFKRRDA